MVYYLKKLIGAFHEFSKVALQVEQLEREEEADFGDLYRFLGDVNHTENHRTEIQKETARLEKEFS